jgi:pimeloyl-ACP methyl ester carboxylesterase
MTTASRLADAREHAGTRPTPGRPGTRLAATAALSSLALSGLACTSGGPGGTDAITARTVTAVATADRAGPAAQERLVDRVPAPVLHWTACRPGDQCATARLPLDYADPHGATIDVALLRVPAKDPGRRLGTLFVNPGGPGDPATDFAAEVPQGLPATILDRFDIVGVDPRGVGGSTQVRCFATKAEQAGAEAPLKPLLFPVTPAQGRSWVAAARALGRACSTTARAVASAMSTTEDARDLDVLRRAVGDRRLTFYGESYGSYLGLVYANMFPGRVRALVIDGIVDPQGLVGTPATASMPVLDRIGSAAASYRALRELLRRCQQAGLARCSFASADTPARFDALASRLRARPLRLAAPGIPAITYTYANLIADTESWLHDPDGYQGLFAGLTGLAQLTAPGGTGPGHADLVRRFLLGRPAAPPPAPGYDNHLEASSATLCTDSGNAADAAAWPAAAAAADRRTPYFGAQYAWITVQCARDTWTAQDPSAYRGPFNHRTAAPVLVIGNPWDPATSYDSAVKVARRLPGSRLVSSDSWGHTALGTSACVDNTAFGYVLNPTAPAPKITHCRGDIQPFMPQGRAFPLRRA